MAVENIIVVGPKKTGSTSAYALLKRDYDGDLNLLPKEKNGLYHLSDAALLDQYSGGVIEVCPDYFDDMRSLVRLKRLQDEHQLSFHIIVLSRAAASRTSSHVRYMVNEGVVTSQLLEDEVNCIVLQSQQVMFERLWAKFFRVSVIDLSDVQATKVFWNDCFGVTFDPTVRENVSPGQATFLKKVVISPAARLVERLGGYQLVERLRQSNAVRKLTSKKTTDRSSSDADRLVKELEEVTTALRDVIKETQTHG